MTFEENLKYVNKIGCHSPGFFHGENEGGYHIQQNPIEFAKFLTYIQDRGTKIKNYLEVGSASGGFIRAIHEQIGFDFGMMLDNGAYQEWMQEPNIEKFRHKVLKLTCDSHTQPAIDILKAKNVIFDLIWIDGDHSYEGVLQDIELVMPYVDFNTLICFHDIDCDYVPGVRKAYQETLLNKKLVEVERFVNKNKDGMSFGIGICKTL